jgi:hypothetical protein
MKQLLASNPELAEATAKRNSSLQGAYLIMAARALGLDCGPMSGFDAAKVDEEFFAGGKPCFGCDQEFFPEGHVKSNFLCNLGYGDSSGLHPRLPRVRSSSVNGFCTKCSSMRFDTKIAVSDPTTLRGLTQFLDSSSDASLQMVARTGHAKSDMREGGFCAILIQAARKSLILKRRDGGVVDRARLEIHSARAC